MFPIVQPSANCSRRWGIEARPNKASKASHHFDFLSLPGEDEREDRLTSINPHPLPSPTLWAREK
jgi:hypothetical protein